MKSWNRSLSLLLVVAAIGTVVWVNAGSLTPPAGPVAPTMKTLVQVEPRTDVQTLAGDFESVHVIAQPGSYYLTANIAGVSGKHGIKIEADDVTLDLSGFQVLGAEGSFSGVWASGPRRNLAIRNGTVAQWGSYGVDFTFAHDSIVESIRASSNGFSGIGMWYNGTIRDCVAESNSDRGFIMGNGNSVSHCSATYNGGAGFSFGSTCSFTNCIAESNSDRGFSAVQNYESVYMAEQSTFLNCVAAYNGVDGFAFGTGSTFNNCTSRSNGARGFGGDTDGEGANLANAVTFNNCTASDNSNDGYTVGDSCAFNNCASFSNGFAPARPKTATLGKGSGGSTPGPAPMNLGFGTRGISARNRCTVTGCTLTDNSSFGIEAYDNISITDSNVSSNWSHGIYINSGNIVNTHADYNGGDGINCFASSVQVTGSTANFNGGNGMFLRDGCKVENCTVSNNWQSGILVDPLASPVVKGVVIRNNNVRLNFNDGIQVTSNSTVEGNHSEENGSLGRSGGSGAGVKVNGTRNRIDNNRVVRNDDGVAVTAAPNTITRNSAAGNGTADYSIVIGNDVGPIGTASAVTSPWANLSEP